MSNKIQIKIDASAMKKSACSRYLYLNVIEGLKPRGNKDMSLHYGSSIHKFCETYVQTEDMVNSMIATHAYYRKDTPPEGGTKDWLTINHLTSSCGVLKDWIDRDTNVEYMINSKDGSKLCEVRLALPIYVSEDVEVLLCGTLDKIVRFKRGAVCIGDYKTTSTYKKDDYFVQYRLDPQMMTYRFMLEWCAKNKVGGILEEIGSQKIGCFFDAIFLSKTKDTEVSRSTVMFHSDSDMLQYEMLLMQLVHKLVQFGVTKARPLKEGMVNGSCTHLYGACQYFGLCSAPDATSEQMMIRNYFEQREYNPLNY